MGANQSSSSDGGRWEAGREAKSSYYDLLGVDRLASDEEIKRAYRRKALELHPDRNYGNVEHTTKLFAEVQAAYEVLSDSQERAWYDSHESSILSGQSTEPSEQYAHNIRITTADDIVRMMGRFRGNVEFSDKPSGFYGFLKETFEQLAQEEQAAAQWEGLEIPDYPSFGHKNDNYSDAVKTFYAMWNGFATKKNFSWKDKWRYSEAPDRRIRRAMEKENKKVREEAVREFNDAVRALVAFVRKRDPRYTPNTQSEADRQQVLRDAAAAQAARSRAENMAKMNEEVPEWAKAREPEDAENIEEEESEEEQFECVACRKTFKSEKQFDAHERSKKHIKAVQSLRKILQREGHALDLDDEISDSAGVQTPLSMESRISSDRNEGSADAKTFAEVENRRSFEDKASELTKHADGLSLSRSTSPVIPNDDGLGSVLDRDGEKLYEDINDTSEEGSDDGSSAQNVSGSVMDRDRVLKSEGVSESRTKMGKAAQKRAKKAAQQQAATQSDSLHKCGTCGTGFPSKTRLFQHLKDFEHAQPILKASKGGKGKKR